MKVFNRPVKLSGHSRKINSITIKALEYDHEGNILRASGTTVPTGAGYAKGCLFIQTTNDCKGLYENEGTPLAANFSPVGERMVKLALAAGNANAFAFVWQNPESTKVIVTRVLVNRTTAGGTGSSVLDVGPAADATSTADTIIDGLDLNATGIADNIADKGSNGTTRSVVLDEKGGTTDYITGKILAQNAAALAGYVYIYYRTV